jgi:hypothetical protein
VLSMTISSKSASSANAEKTRSHTPRFCHRANRFSTLFQGSNSSGRVHHPQHRLDEPAIVRTAAPAVTRFARQQVWHLLPLIIAPIQTCHKFTSSASWANSIMLNVNTT